MTMYSPPAMHSPLSCPAPPQIEDASLGAACSTMLPPPPPPRDPATAAAPKKNSGLAAAAQPTYTYTLPPPLFGAMPLMRPLAGSIASHASAVVKL